jgi:hypothetical protein
MISVQIVMVTTSRFAAISILKEGVGPDGVFLGLNLVIVDQNFSSFGHFRERTFLGKVFDNGPMPSLN